MKTGKIGFFAYCSDSTELNGIKVGMNIEHIEPHHMCDSHICDSHSYVNIVKKPRFLVFFLNHAVNVTVAIPKIFQIYCLYNIVVAFIAQVSCKFYQIRIDSSREGPDDVGVGSTQ